MKKRICERKKKEKLKGNIKEECVEMKEERDEKMDKRRKGGVKERETEMQRKVDSWGGYRQQE